MSKPRIVVFFSGQGGACKGLENAGWEVWAQDIARQPRYLNPARFTQGDAIADFWKMLRLIRPHAVGGSPPCQKWTLAQRIQALEHPDLITPFRELCLESGLPYYIENVEGAPLKDPVLLCGTMFPGLNTRRHRLFESNVKLWVPEHPAHTAANQPVKMGRPLQEGDWYHAVGNFNGGPEDEHKRNYVKRNMGVPWMSRDGVRECIPPVYAELIGKQILEAL
jgi:DNA (cytosine-5)-methyltransferase 1